MTPSQIQTIKKKEELRTRGKTISADLRSKETRKTLIWY